MEQLNKKRGGIIKKLKKFLLKRKKHLIFLLIYTILLIPLPYYTTSPGGVNGIEEKIYIENQNKSNETFFETYVSVRRGRIPILLYASLFKSWEIHKVEELPGGDYELQNHISRLELRSANNMAIYHGVKEAGKEINSLESKMLITYILEDAKTNLEVGDIIENLTFEELKELITNSNGEIQLEVIRNNDKFLSKTTIIEIEGEEKMGIVMSYLYDVDTTPKIEIKNDKSEQGPSAGFMTALTIFDQLTDLERKIDGKIAGTGTIDIDGNIGAIGSVDLKIIGADKEGMDYFLVPLEYNYETALETKEKFNLDIEIIGFNNFKEAIDYLYEWGAIWNYMLLDTE